MAVKGPSTATAAPASAGAPGGAWDGLANIRLPFGLDGNNLLSGLMGGGRASNVQSSSQSSVAVAVNPAITVIGGSGSPGVSTSGGPSAYGAANPSSVQEQVPSSMYPALPQIGPMDPYGMGGGYGDPMAYDAGGGGGDDFTIPLLAGAGLLFMLMMDGK